MESPNQDNQSVIEGSARNGHSITIRSTSSGASVHDLSVLTGVTRDAIDHIVHEPLSSGFLSKYCDNHFCSENIKFITEIDRFQDQFLRDKVSWTRGSWRTIDVEIDIRNAAFSDSNFDIDRDFIAPLKEGRLIPAELWPSKILSREAIVESIIKIWDTFLAKDAKYWICIPSSALMNTMRRIKLLHIYGKEVFMEALKDPIKTIEKDIYPRFLVSDEYKLMMSCLKNFAEPSPAASNLKLSKPAFIILQRYQLIEIEKNLIKFTLQDLIDDQILYGEFLKYLEKIVSSENLLCLRAIRIFKESFLSTIPTEKSKAFDNAWIVYRYFIASGSPFEISISHRKKKEVMRRLADPHLHIFDSIEQSAFSALKTHYSSYVMTKEFNELYRIIVHKRNSITAPAPPIMSAGSRASSLKLPPTKDNSEVKAGCFSMK